MAKVLLVEDDNNLREIYQARLMAEGYDIVAAQNGEEALVMAKQNKPDLVISDVMMPRISGFEMLDILRNTDQLKDTKVIMLTALGQAEDQTRADNLGADKYLVKSQVTLEDIVNAAKELLGESGALPAAPAATEAAAPAAAAPGTTDSAAPAPAASPEPAAEPAVPASVVPQPDTTVVVPPAPANPTPPTVTAVPMPPSRPTDSTAPAPAADPAAATDPEPASPTTTAAEASVAGSAPESIEAEETSLQAQIDGYTKAPVGDTPESASNDQTMADAVEQLADTTETVTEAPESAPAPAGEAATAAEAPAAPSANDQVAVTGKKVIQPIGGDASPAPAPDINDLLAKEEAKEQATGAGSSDVPPAGDSPVPPPTPAAPLTPEGSDHNNFTL